MLIQPSLVVKLLLCTIKHKGVIFGILVAVAVLCGDAVLRSQLWVCFAFDYQELLCE